MIIMKTMVMVNQEMENLVITILPPLGMEIMAATTVVAHTGINDKDIEEGTLGCLPLY